MKKLSVLIIALLVIVMPIYSYASEEELIISVDYDIEALYATQPVGNEISYALTLTNGSNHEINNTILKVELPELLVSNQGLTFNQSLEELRIQGVLPTLDNNQLTYDFISLTENFEETIIIKLSSVNGSNLNGAVASVSAHLSLDGEQQTDRSASVTLTAEKNIASTNKLLGIKENISDVLLESEAIQYKQFAVYGIGASVRKDVNGSIAVSEHNIVYEYIVPKEFKYVEDNSGVMPSMEALSDNRTKLVWQIIPHELDEYYHEKIIEVTFEVIDEIQLYTHVETEFYATSTYIDQESLTTESLASNLVVPNDKFQIEEPEKRGSTIRSNIRGPKNGVGDYSTSVTVNDDPVVTDSANLLWSVGATANSMTHPATNINSYDIVFLPDSNTNIFEFNSGTFGYRPNSQYTTLEPLLKPVYMSMSVWYEDSTSWDRLLPSIGANETYGAKELGIDDSRTVSVIWLHLHDNNDPTNIFVNGIGDASHTGSENGSLPAGLTNQMIKFHMSVKPGYVGSVQAEAGVAYSGFGINRTTGGKNIAEQYTYGIQRAQERVGINNLPILNPAMQNIPSPTDDPYLPSLEGAFRPKTAQVVTPAEGDSRIISADLFFKDSSKNNISEGENSLIVKLTNDKASLNSITGKFEKFIILPEGVRFDSHKMVIGGAVEIISNHTLDDKYQVLKITYDNEVTMYAGATLNIEIPVIVDERAPSVLPVKVVGYPSFDFTVNDTENNSGDFTIKREDKYDLANSPYDIYETTGVYTYMHSSKFISASELMNNQTYMNTGPITKDGLVDSRITVINDKETALSNMNIIYTVPKKGQTIDLGMDTLTNEFSLYLRGPVNNFDFNQQDKFIIEYTITPLDEDVKVWKRKEDVKDFKEVNQIRITKDTSKVSLLDKVINFDFTLELDYKSIDKSDETLVSFQNHNIKINQGKAFNVAPSLITFTEEKLTVTFESNGGTPISPLTNIRVNDVIDKPKDPIKEGYIFMDWYIDESLETLFDFSKPITQSMTLYAGWKLEDVKEPSEEKEEVTPPTGVSKNSEMWLMTVLISGVMLYYKSSKKIEE